MSRMLELLGWALLGPIVMIGAGALLLGTGLVSAERLPFLGPLMPLLLAGLGWWRLRAGGHAIGELIGFARATWTRDLWIATQLGLATLALAVLSLRLMGSILPVPPVQSLPGWLLVYLGTVGAAIPGVGEELFYRGMMLRIGRNLPKALVIALSAIGFSLWHIANPAYLPHTLVIGIVYAHVALRVGRLAPVILAHIAANAGLAVLLLLDLPVLGRS